jgi:hypothetical protein
MAGSRSDGGGLHFPSSNPRTRRSVQGRVQGLPDMRKCSGTHGSRKEGMRNTAASVNDSVKCCLWLSGLGGHLWKDKYSKKGDSGGNICCLTITRQDHKGSVYSG